MKLNELTEGRSAVILSVGGEGVLRRHFLDMGIIPGAEVTFVKFAPMGDPMELRVHGYELTLRCSDAEKIVVEPCDPVNEVQERQQRKSKSNHPGLGELQFHVHADEHPLPDTEIVSFALAGNQNCGKTTLFNQLTGANQHVGNFPGVTVDKKSGPIRGYKDTLVTDLPGIYSMSPYTAEEIISREFVLREKPKGIINIVDGTAIERNLYLTLQLMTLEKPMVLAVNMMDELTGNGGSIDINLMEDMLGIPVVPISAMKNQGVDELIRHAYHVGKYQEKPGRLDFCSADDRGGAVHRCIHAVMHMIEDHAAAADIPVRFAATKLIEKDQQIEEALCLSRNEKETIEHLILTLEEESGLDCCAAIADMRYRFIRKLCAACVIRPKQSKEQLRSLGIDRILTGKYTAIPAFILIMGCVFFLTFHVIGAVLQELFQTGIGRLTLLVDGALTAADVNAGLHSLVVDGIVNGVGSVLSFVPVVVTLFFFLSLLEDSGYMARVAFVMDQLLRKLGLSGRSIVPMLIGFGCTVPGVMASRTLPSERDRKMTIILTPFMSCSAKMPIYGFLTSIFFPGYAAVIMVGIYFFGIVTAVLIALISKNTFFKGEAVPFVMELPNYRLPSVKNVAMLLWEKAKDFVERAFTVILIATVIIWFFQSFDFSFMMVKGGEGSILSVISGKIAPLFRLQGFADWRIVTALISGLLAKESVVASLNVTFGSAAALMRTITPAGAGALLVFCLLYTPCVAAIAAVRRELGLRWSIFLVVFQCLLAWTGSLLVSCVLHLLI